MSKNLEWFENTHSGETRYENTQSGGTRYENTHIGGLGCLFVIVLCLYVFAFVQITNFSRPCLIGPQQTLPIFNLTFHPNSSMLHFTSEIYLHTNTSVFKIPVHIYNGRLKVTPVSITCIVACDMELWDFVNNVKWCFKTSLQQLLHQNEFLLQ